MPDLRGGHDVWRAMRREAGDRCPSSWSPAWTTWTRAKAYDFGATDFIAKPINPAFDCDTASGSDARSTKRCSTCATPMRGTRRILQACPIRFSKSTATAESSTAIVPNRPGAIGTHFCELGRKTVAEPSPGPAQGFLAALAQTPMRPANRSGSKSNWMVGDAQPLVSSSRLPEKPSRPRQTPLHRVVQDITEHKEAERSILRLAHFDT
jgi:hypothetical protein